MPYSIGYSGNGDPKMPGVPPQTLAIFNSGPNKNDFGPMSDPLTHLDDVAFHGGGTSPFDYLRINEAASASSTDASRSPVALPQTGFNATLNQEVELFTHGLGYLPFFSGDITVDGYKQACPGTMVPIPGGNLNNVGHRFVGFTADTQKVYMHAVGFLASAMVIHWDVRIYDEELGQVSTQPPSFDLSSEGLTVRHLGKIDKDHRYVSGVAAPGDFLVLGKQTISLQNPSGGGDPEIHFSDGVRHGALTSIPASFGNVNPNPANNFVISGTPASL